MYRYTATVIKWVDGDTVDLKVNLGFFISTNMRFRLLNVDTPERNEEGFVEAKLLSETMFPVGETRIVETHKTDKYGRWLVDLPDVTAALSAAGYNKLSK